MPRHSFVILERAKLMHAQQMMPNAQAVAQALQASKAPPKVFKLVGMSAEEVRGLASQVSHEGDRLKELAQPTADGAVADE